MRSTPLALALFAALLIFAACNSGGGKPTPTAGTGASPSPGAIVTTTAEGEVADCSANLARVPASGELSWEQILPAQIPSPVGWEVRDDPGSGPFLNVFQDNDRVGSLELGLYVLEDFDPEQGFPALAGWQDAFYDSLRADRAAAFGEGYAFREDDPAAVRFGGLCGIRYSFTGLTEDGTTNERYVGYATFDRQKLYVVTALYDTATADEGIGFQDEASLRAYEAAMGELIAALQLP